MRAAPASQCQLCRCQLAGGRCSPPAQLIPANAGRTTLAGPARQPQLERRPRATPAGRPQVAISPPRLRCEDCALYTGQEYRTPASTDVTTLLQHCIALYSAAAVQCTVQCFSSALHCTVLQHCTVQLRGDSQTVRDSVWPEVTQSTGSQSSPLSGDRDKASVTQDKPRRSQSLAHSAHYLSDSANHSSHSAHYLSPSTYLTMVTGLCI